MEFDGGVVTVKLMYIKKITVAIVVDYVRLNKETKEHTSDTESDLIFEGLPAQEQKELVT